MFRFHSFLLVLFFALMTLGTATAQTPAPDLKNPDALFNAALASNGLVGDDMQPWHLKANYDILDHQNKVVATGVFEEWWASKDKWKRSYTGAHYSDTEYHLPNGDAHENADWTHDPWPESKIGEALVSPITTLTLSDAAPLRVEETNFGSLKLNCLNRGKFVNLCFAQDSTALRFKGSVGLTTTYNNLAFFQGHNTALEVSMRVNDHALLNVHVLSLTGMSPADENIFETAAVLTPRTSPDSPVKAGKKLRGDDPDFPRQSESNHEHGLVVLSGMIDAQGKTRDLKVLEAPSPALGNAALKAVKTWVYEPYTRDGKPVSANTTVNILYNPGR